MMTATKDVSGMYSARIASRIARVRPQNFQEMAMMILRDGEKWEERAAHTPSIISVSRNGSRYRAWSDIPDTISKTSGATC